jgi:glycosyltransferase involved in cell wall biosynthesis
MKLAVIALTLAPRKSGGIETYFRSLVRTLQEIDKENQYTIVLPKQLIHEIELTAGNFKTLGIGDPGYQKLFRRLRLSKASAEANSAKQIGNLGCDLLHFPLHVIQPPNITGKKVISVMDIQEEYWPEFFSKEDLKSRELSHKSSILEADHIITISDYTKQTIIDKYGIEPEKITSIHLSYDETAFMKPAPKLSITLPKNYFYYPAATWPHKNHLRLLEAFAILKQRQPDFHLVLSGIKMQANNELQKKIDELRMTDTVHVLGYMPDNELPLIYRQAFALVFPSLFEGFGIPLLEAMASGCPVAASSTTSIPEVAGDAAIYFDPLKPEEIAAKMEALIQDSKLRKDLVKKGFHRIKAFSEKRMAEETVAVYEKVAAYV